jgi:hypothetical protein
LPAKGSVVDTFIEGFKPFPTSRYQATYAMSGIKSNRYAILEKIISIL